LRSFKCLLGVTMTSLCNHVITGGGRPEAVQRMRSRRRSRMRSSPSGLIVTRGRLAVNNRWRVLMNINEINRRNVIPLTLWQNRQFLAVVTSAEKPTSVSLFPVLSVSFYGTEYNMYFATEFCRKSLVWHQPKKCGVHDEVEYRLIEHQEPHIEGTDTRRHFTLNKRATA